MHVYGHEVSHIIATTIYPDFTVFKNILYPQYHTIWAPTVIKAPACRIWCNKSQKTAPTSLYISKFPAIYTVLSLFVTSKHNFLH